MTALLFALVVAAGPAQAFDARMAASSAAAERLQGPLDGAWRIRAARGRLLYIIQVSDPPGGAGPLQAAWRDPTLSGPAGVGPVESIALTPRHLSLAFAGVSVALHGDPRRGWRGHLIRDGQTRVVTLERP